MEKANYTGPWQVPWKRAKKVCNNVSVLYYVPSFYDSTLLGIHSQENIMFSSFLDNS